MEVIKVTEARKSIYKLTTESDSTVIIHNASNFGSAAGSAREMLISRGVHIAGDYHCANTNLGDAARRGEAGIGFVWWSTDFHEPTERSRGRYTGTKEDGARAI